MSQDKGKIMKEIFDGIPEKETLSSFLFLDKSNIQGASKKLVRIEGGKYYY